MFLPAFRVENAKRIMLNDGVSVQLFIIGVFSRVNSINVISGADLSGISLCLFNIRQHPASVQKGFFRRV